MRGPRTYLLLLAAFVLPLAAGQQREPGYGVVTVGPHDGWYTEEQAQRGEESYLEHCLRCHGVDLGGIIGQTPPLAGQRFLHRWRHNSVNRLFNYTKGMMPLDMPATLSDQTYIDILAYVLRMNGLPAGGDELRADRNQLGKLVIPPSAPMPPDESEGVGPNPTGEPPESVGEDQSTRDESEAPATADGLPEEGSGVEPEAQ